MKGSSACAILFVLMLFFFYSTFLEEKLVQNVSTTLVDFMQRYKCLRSYEEHCCLYLQDVK